LAIPRTQDGNTYNWPFIHQFNCPGIFTLNPGMITNITVIKGGDSQQIAWNNRMGIVDVRLEIGSLFASMVAEEGDVKLLNRPTLNSYLKNLEDEKMGVEKHYHVPSGLALGNSSMYDSVYAGNDNTIISNDQKIAKSTSPTQAINSNETPRVMEENKTLQASLNQLPNNF
jgi:hypothetical protein